MNALDYLDIDQFIYKAKSKVAWNEKRKFSYSKNVTNFCVIRPGHFVEYDTLISEEKSIFLITTSTRYVCKYLPRIFLRSSLI